MPSRERSKNAGYDYRTSLRPPVARPAASVGAQAVGALALAAVAVGALAIGALAIGRLGIGRARIRRLEIDELVVRRLRIAEQSIQARDTRPVSIQGLVDDLRIQLARVESEIKRLLQEIDSKRREEMDEKGRIEDGEGQTAKLFQDLVRAADAYRDILQSIASLLP